MKKLSTPQVKAFLQNLPFMQGTAVQPNLRKRETPLVYKEDEDYLILVSNFNFTEFDPKGTTLQDKFLSIVEECIEELGYRHKAYSDKGFLQVPMTVWYYIKQKWEAFVDSTDYASYEVTPTPTLVQESKGTFDFSLSDEFAINQNIEAFIDHHIELLPEQYPFTEADIAFIKQYSGYGGLGNKGTVKNEIAKGLFTEYYTPQAIIDEMWALAHKHGYTPGLVLENSAAIGKFLWNKEHYTHAEAYEINKYSAMVFRILALFNDLPVRMYVENFEKRFIQANRSVKNGDFEGKSSFDLVIGNPPYGDFTGYYAALGEKDYTKAKNLVDYFIFRGLDCLKSGGLLVYLIGVEPQNGGLPFLSKDNDYTKLAIAEKADLIDAYRLPKGAIPRTDVVCDIVVFRKK